MAIRRNQTRVAAARPYDFGHIDIAARIDPDAMRREEIARCARILAATPACAKFPLTVEDAHPSARRIGAGSAGSGPHSGTETQFGDQHVVIPIDKNLTRPSHVGPFGKELAFGCEKLDATVLPVGDV